MTKNELDNFLKLFYQFKKESIDKKYGFNDEWNIFIKKILFLSPKSYGTKIQNRIIEKNDLEHVKANQNLGDFKKDNEYFEIKTSLITITNKSANITGIRPWQKIDGYYIFIIDARVLTTFKTYQFRLNKNQMDNELKELKAIPINGTKKANEGNSNLPLRFGLSLESDNFKRWIHNYLFDKKDNIIGNI